MKNSVVLAAAFAVGMTAFAAHAQSGAQTGGQSEARVQETPLVMAHARHAAGLSAQDAVSPEKNKTVSVGEARKQAAARAKERYESLVESHALENGVSVALAHAVVMVESSYRPYSLGRAGEVGLMQIKPATASLMGYKGTAAGLFDPETNIRYGMKYLGKAQKLGDGTTCGTILKYNAGHGAKRMNKTSRKYCEKVKRHLAASGQASVQSAKTADSGV